MYVFLGLSIVLLIALIVGFIKPSIILRWSKKPTKLKGQSFKNPTIS
jgi:hypothetical protein